MNSYNGAKKKNNKKKCKLLIGKTCLKKNVRGTLFAKPTP